MKIKAKIFCIGMSMLGMTVYGGALKAEETLPLDFKEGDILSAELMNTILQRINNVSTGFARPADLVGNWTCKTAEGSNTGGCHNQDVSSPYKFKAVSGSSGYYSATFNIAIKAVNSELLSIESDSILLGCSAYFGYNADNPAPDPPFNYVGILPFNNVLFLESENVALTPQVDLNLTKLSPYKFRMVGDATGAVVAECSRNDVPPPPPTSLSATASGTSVSLSWTDQSSDETGFKVQTKTSVSGSWSTTTTTAANATSASVTASSGNNWYRVLATNSNGDSITSNEILVEIQ